MQRAEESAVCTEVPENDGRGDAEVGIGISVVPNVVIVVEIRGFAVVARIAAADGRGCCGGRGGLIGRKQRYIYGGRIRIGDRAGVQTSVRQYFARSHSVGIANVDSAAQNDAARHKTVKLVMEILVAVVFLRIDFDGR